MLSTNIQSINYKFNELDAFIDELSSKKVFNVICLQETWTSEMTTYYNVPYVVMTV